MLIFSIFINNLPIDHFRNYNNLVYAISKGGYSSGSSHSYSGSRSSSYSGSKSSTSDYKSGSYSNSNKSNSNGGYKSGSFSKTPPSEDSNKKSNNNDYDKSYTPKEDRSYSNFPRFVPGFSYHRGYGGFGSIIGTLFNVITIAAIILIIFYFIQKFRKR